MTKFLFLAGVVAAAWAGADEAGPKLDASFLKTFVNSPDYNGIQAKEAARFYEKWGLVTTRFRKDNEQIRLVYGNPKAMAGLQDDEPVFPDGSMFAKIVYVSAADPSFPSAQTPDSIERILLMKKDSKRYADTGGWGYAVFRGESAQAPADTQKHVAKSCHACHELVKEKDFVFSEPIFLAGQHGSLTGSLFENKFIEKSVPELTVPERKALSDLKAISAAKVRRATMPIFRGSIWTSVGPMAEFAVKNGVPFILHSDQHTSFVITSPLAKDEQSGCERGAAYALKMRGQRVVRGRVCGGKLIRD